MEIAEKIQARLKTLDSRLAVHIRRHLVAPYCSLRNSQFEPEALMRCWIFLAEEQTNTGIAYCESVNGSLRPWGIVWLTGVHASTIGHDSAWFGSLEEAILDSGIVNDLHIWRVYKQADVTSSYVAVSEESDWESAWLRLSELRAIDAVSRYHCLPSDELIKRISDLNIGP